MSESSEEQKEQSAEALEEEALVESSTEALFAENPKPGVELKELQDKHVRLYAEFENFRRRTAKESFELMATANARLVPVVDYAAKVLSRKHENDGKENT